MCFSFLSLNAFTNTIDSLPKEGNPIIKNKFTADPAALVYKNTVYLYTGHHEAPIKKNGYEIHEWLCYSSTNMVTWKEHASPLNLKAFVWANYDSWELHVVKKMGNFIGLLLFLTMQ